MRCHRCGRPDATCVDVSDNPADDGCAVCITARRRGERVIMISNPPTPGSVFDEALRSPPKLGRRSGQARYLAALDELVRAAERVADTFPVHGMGVGYPETFTAFDDVVCEITEWRNAEHASPLKWCDECGALEGECEVSCPSCVLCVVCSGYGRETRATTTELAVRSDGDGGLCRIPGDELDVCAGCAELASEYPIGGAS